MDRTSLIFIPMLIEGPRPNERYEPPSEERSKCMKARIAAAGVLAAGAFGCLFSTTKSIFIDFGLSPLARLTANAVGYASVVGAAALVVPMSYAHSVPKIVKVGLRLIGTTITAGGAFGPDPETNYFGGLSILGPVVAFSPEIYQRIKGTRPVLE